MYTSKSEGIMAAVDDEKTIKELPKRFLYGNKLV